MLGNTIKNKLTVQANEPVTYYIEPKVRSRINIFDLNTQINANTIEQTILNYKNKYLGSNESNVKAWHSNWHIHHECKEFSNLIKIVENKVLYSVDVDHSNLRKVECIESWAIIYKKGDKTSRHKHSDQQYSAVYYAKAEENTSPLKFDNHLIITPKTGMLICFPGWLYHSVPELDQEQERICMSFNLNCIMMSPTI